MKKQSIIGMRAIVETISSIDENSKKILFKHFDQNNVNHLEKQAPILMANIDRINHDVITNDKLDDFNSDQFQSDSSGNHSENDEINKIQ